MIINSDYWLYCLLNRKTKLDWSDWTKEDNTFGFSQMSGVKISKDSFSAEALQPTHGAYEKLAFTVVPVEVGCYYELTFTEHKKLISGETYQNNSNQYIYGCTVTTKSKVDEIVTSSKLINAPDFFNYDGDPRDTAFMWKEPFLDDGYEEEKTYNVSLTFYASESEMYWLWDFANIHNDAVLEYSISNINVRKIEFPEDKPYLNFPETTFNEWTYDTNWETDAYEADGKEYTNASGNKYTATQNYLRYSYRTSATESLIDLRVETGSGWEFFNIPIEGLVVGKNYKITFNVDTTPTSLTINKTNLYGCIVQNNQQITSTQIISSSATGNHLKVLNSTGSVSGNEITFTATANTMYWVWQCGGIENKQWAHIVVSNAQISEL